MLQLEHCFQNSPADSSINTKKVVVNSTLGQHSNTFTQPCKPSIANAVNKSISETWPVCLSRCSESNDASAATCCTRCSAKASHSCAAFNRELEDGAFEINSRARIWSKQAALELKRVASIKRRARCSGQQSGMALGRTDTRLSAMTRFDLVAVSSRIIQNKTPSERKGLSSDRSRCATQEVSTAATSQL